MNVDAIVRDPQHKLEEVVQALLNNLDATNNFAPDGSVGQVLMSNGTDLPPSWQDIPTVDPSTTGQMWAKVNDTNVTVTLTGQPQTSLVAPVLMTLGWTGQLGVTRGGTGSNLSATGPGVLVQATLGSVVTVLTPTYKNSVLVNDDTGTVSWVEIGGTNGITVSINDTFQSNSFQSNAFQPKTMTISVSIAALPGTITYAQLPTGGGTWANGGDLTLTGGNLLITGVGATFGSGVTTAAQSAILTLNAGTNTGANNQDARIDFSRAGPVIWEAGILGSVAANTSWSLRDMVNSLSVLIATPSNTNATLTMNLRSTTAAVGSIFALNAGTNSGSNNQDAYVEYQRGQTALWREGVQGSVAANTSWTLRDVANSLSYIIVATGGNIALMGNTANPTLTLGRGLAAAAASSTFEITAGSNTAANNQDAIIDYRRNTTTLWRHGVIGSVSADATWRLRDVVNSRTVFSATATAASVVSLSPDVTTQNLSTAFVVNTGTNSGGNDKDAALEWQRGGTALWREGVLGSVAANANWTLRDIVNNANALVITQGVTPAITTGLWNATKIGLLYGGTNADLSATGGASQVLLQASVGAAITVRQLTFADLGGVGGLTYTWPTAHTTNGFLMDNGTGVLTWVTIAGNNNISVSVSDVFQTDSFQTDSFQQKTLTISLGNISYNQLPTGGGTWANNGALSITGGVTTVAGLSSSADPGITLTAAASRIVPGATSLSLRNNANSADNLILTDAGAATFRSTVDVTTELRAPQIDTVGATDLVFQRNNVTKLTLGNSVATFVDGATMLFLTVTTAGASITGDVAIIGSTTGLTCASNRASTTGPTAQFFDTWNLAGGVFTGITLLVTDTASSAASTLLSLGTVAAGTQFSVTRAGIGTLATSLKTPILDSGSATNLVLNRNGVTAITLGLETITFVGTTTFNNLLYTWPSSQPLSVAAFTNDGTGALSWSVIAGARNRINTSVNAAFQDSTNAFQQDSFQQKTFTIDISSAYVGQTSITTLGTITTGTWNGSSISTTYTDAKITSVVGTARRISVNADFVQDNSFQDTAFQDSTTVIAGPIILDISPFYVGQSSITIVGTLVSGAVPASLIVAGTFGAGDYTFAGNVFCTNGDLKVSTIGNGLYIAEGLNSTMGVSTLVAGQIQVNTTKVTANSRIQITRQNDPAALGALATSVASRVAGVSFLIRSANVLDTADVAWVILEPA